MSRILSCGRDPLTRIACDGDQVVTVKIGKLRVYNIRLLEASRQAISSTALIVSFSIMSSELALETRRRQVGLEFRVTRAANSLSLFPFHTSAALVLVLSMWT